MPYYTAPGGAATAALARSLMGLGNASIQQRAARSATLRRRSQRAGMRFMSGMGLGVAHAAAAGTPVIRRQAGFFMGPGGGPGGGPFQFPGYMSGMGMHGGRRLGRLRGLRGLGQDDSGIDTTSIDYSGATLTPPSDITGGASPSLILMPGVPASDLTPTMAPVSSTLTPNYPQVSTNTQDIATLYSAGVATGQIQPASASPAAGGITSLFNSLFGAKPTVNAQGVPIYSASPSMASVLPIVLVGGLGLALLGGLGKKRR